MKTTNCVFFFSIYTICVALYSQDSLQTNTIDSAYLEDQFYIGVTYNLLLEKPDNISQNNFSSGIQFGFVKDIPLNKRRNNSFGIGLGYAVNSYYTNLRATKVSNLITYEVIAPTVSYKRNKIEMHLLEVPIAFRWRTSTIDTYKFWRIYGGLKVGYLFANASKYIDPNTKNKFFNPDIRKLQYGLYLSFGYNTWNFYAHYLLHPIFRKGLVTVSGEDIEMRTLSIGLIFYIL